jgi:Family of unknown function (DUF5757)
MDRIKLIFQRCRELNCSIDTLMLPDGTVAASLDDLIDVDLENVTKSEIPVNDYDVYLCKVIHDLINSTLGGLNINYINIDSYEVTCELKERLNLEYVFANVECNFATLTHGGFGRVEQRISRIHCNDVDISMGKPGELIICITLEPSNLSHHEPSRGLRVPNPSFGKGSALSGTLTRCVSGLSGSLDSDDEKVYVRVMPTKFVLRSLHFDWNIFYRVADVLDCTISEVSYDDIRCTAGIAISHPWERHIFADIVTNDDRVSDLMCIFENAKPLCQKKYMSLACLSARCIITYTKGYMKVHALRIPNRQEVILIINIIARAFQIYDEKYESLKDIYSEILDHSETKEEVSSFRTPSSITWLREEVPALFIHNYTRECPVLPVIVSDEELASGMFDDRRVIRYPDPPNEYSRWYTSGEPNMYVGLKKNRLENSDLFPYLVTCYLTDHTDKPKSDTYAYYHGISKLTSVKSLAPGKFASLPKSMRADFDLDETYKRLGIEPNTFVGCIRAVFGSPTGKSYPQLDIDHYFEELYQCSILVIDINPDGKYSIPAPSGNMWEPSKYKDGIIIIKNIRLLYRKTYISYELLTHEPEQPSNLSRVPSNLSRVPRHGVRKVELKYNIDTSPLWKKIAQKKMDMAEWEPQPPNPETSFSESIVGQYINEYGVRSAAIVEAPEHSEEAMLPYLDSTSTSSQRWIPCNTRPTIHPVVEKKPGLLQEHLEYMNSLRRSFGVPEKIWKSSDHSYVYLPKPYF